MTSFEDLEPAERDMLLKFPVYISMLAAEHDDCLDKTEKKAAVKFCHVKTFTCDPLLAGFYQAADENFERNLAELDQVLPVDKSEREEVIRNELLKIEKILLKLGTDYSLVMHRSMRAFKKHVSNAHRNVLEYFLFPLPIKGVTD